MHTSRVACSGGPEHIDGFHTHSQSIQYKVLNGVAEIAPYVMELAHMAKLYEEAPYFCQADLEHDIEHVNKIMKHPHGVVCAAFHTGKIVGVIMGRPQTNVTCVNAAFPNEADVLYISDCLVLPQYRKQHLATELYGMFEAKAREMGYKRISCAIVPGAEALSAELAAVGFQQYKKGTPFTISWTNVNALDATDHQMDLWMKDIPIVA